MVTKTRTGQEIADKAAESVEEDLRRRAEGIAHEKLAVKPENAAKLSARAAAIVLHELQVHQIELEMQNEELRRSQQELEASRARYFELYNLAPVGYLTLSENGLILRANLTFTTLVDMIMRALINRPFSGLIYREDQDIFYLWRKLLFETRTPQECELRLLKRDGTQFWVRLVANLAKESDGESVIRAIVSDISESKRIAVELATANLKVQETSKAKSTFLANMSHELRTPLNTVIGFSEVMQDKLFGPLNEKQEKFMENIASSGRHLLSLINDILDISKVEASKMQLDLKCLNIEELCQGTIAVFSEKARKQQVELSYAIDSSMDGVPFMADSRKLKQILYNLVDNGVKFNRPNGSVSVQVRKISGVFEPYAVQIVVEDTGIGISEEDQEKLFLPFSQLAQSYYDKQTDGTGLGLALSKHLVELHGGTITIRSECGKGCRFIVLLPANVQDNPF